MWELLGNHDQNADLKVENFIVVHDHVDRPAELFPVSLRVNLKIDVSVYPDSKFNKLKEVKVQTFSMGTSWVLHHCTLILGSK